MKNFSLPVVDVVIPNYNKGKYLKSCLESVLKQSYKKWKIIIVDDNSSDSSTNILKKYNKNKKIKIIYLKKIKDLPSAEIWL